VLAVVGIPVVMFPILKKYNEALSLGFFSLRFIEAISTIVHSLILLTLLTLSQEFVIAGAPDASHFQTLGTLLLAVRLGEGVFAGIAFSLGSLMFYYLLYKSKLIPRWLSGWALIGAILFLASSFLPLFGYGARSMIYILLNVPGGLQEMVLAVWLIVKGFNPSAIASSSA
jgi:hypothetical protein